MMNQANYWDRFLTIIVSGLIMLFLITGCEGKDAPIYDFQSQSNKRAIGQSGMVASAHPLASEAGLRMLKNGGNAVDAAVATAFALNVVEPNMSGIGGGGSMLIWLGEQNMTDYVDFYSAKHGETYRNMNSEELNDELNLLSTGIPGTVAGLLEALEKHGDLSRAEVMAPAIEYAEIGFPVYPTLGQFIIDNEDKLGRYQEAYNTFFPHGESIKVGEILRQPILAETLNEISENGKSAFYTGPIAESIVEVLNKGHNPVSLSDFENYSPQWQKVPLCNTYKGYTVLSAPLPQTGIFIVQGLNILENYELNDLGLPTNSAEAFDILASTLRLSIADRIEYVSDPNWRNIPIEGLVSKEYATMRADLVGTGEAVNQIEAGNASSFTNGSIEGRCNAIDFRANQTMVDEMQFQSKDSQFASNFESNNFNGQAYDEAEGTGETTHISVVDSNGNAVSLSTTLSPVFGSGAMVNGFILNTSGYNFNNISDDSEWVSNHPYRIRSSTISPTIILEDNQVKLVIGAPGGGRIPTAVLQNIVYLLDYDLDPLDAVNMPRIFPSRDNSEVQIEVGFNHNVLSKVSEMGYDIQSLSQGYARLYLVYKKDNWLIGVSDPRHDGEPRGY